MITDRVDLCNISASTFVCYKNWHLTPTPARTIIAAWTSATMLAADRSATMLALPRWGLLPSSRAQMVAANKPVRRDSYKRKGAPMILRKSALLSVALLILATLVLPLGTSSASVSAPQSSEAVPGSPADPSALASEMPTDQIIVKYKIPASMVGTTGPASALAMQRLSDAAGVPLTFVREMSGDAYVLGLPSRMPLEEVQAMADRMSALPEVEYAEPDAIMQHTLTPNDPSIPTSGTTLLPALDTTASMPRQPGISPPARRASSWQSSTPASPTMPISPVAACRGV